MHEQWRVIALTAATAFAGCAGADQGGDNGSRGGTAPAPEPPPLATRTIDPKLAEIAELEQNKDRDGRLQELLGDADAEVRLAAVRALAHVRHAGDAGALAGRFEDSDLRVVQAALFASGLLETDKQRAPVAPLSPLLGHADAGVRAAAVEAIGRIGDHTALEQALELLRDPDAAVRGEAALAVWRIQQGAPKVDKETPDPVTQAIQQRVHGAVMPLARKAANEPDENARWKMCFAVAELRRTPARRGPEPADLEEADLTELRRLVGQRLDDANPNVRGYAAQAAGRIWGAGAGPVLRPLLHDPDWTVRVLALRGLSKSEDAGTVAAVRAMAAADAHPQARRSALESLATRGDSECEAVVVEALKATSPSVRRAAMDVWAKLKRADALPKLERALGDPDAWSRAAAIEAIGATLAPPTIAEAGGATDGEEPEAPVEPDPGHTAAVKRLLQARMTEGNNTDRAAVMSACESIPIGLACDLLEQGCRVDVLEVRGTACAVIQGRAKAIVAAGRDLVPALNAAWKQSQDASEYELRQEVIKALVALEVKRAIPLLREALAADPHVAVRKAAAEGLTKLGEQDVTVPAAQALRLAGSPDAVTARSAEIPSRLRIETSKGDMELELFVEVAPVHTFNIVTLARKGFYDGLLFHRVVPSFVIQGGDPRGTGWGDPGYTINNEVNPHRYLKGTLGMPDAGLDTGGCQIFINHMPTPHLDGRYTTFGQVVKGLAVIDRIEVGDTITRIRVIEQP